MASRDSARGNARIWNILTVAALAGTVIVIIVYIVVLVQPAVVSDEAKVTPTQVSLLVLPTATPTLPPTATTLQIQTWTPSPTSTPDAQSTATPTRSFASTPSGPEPTSTFWPTWTPRPPTDTAGPAPGTRSNYPFGLLNNEVTFTSNFANAAGCSWLGIAGQVFDNNGNSLTGIAVVLNGGGFQNHVVYSGTAPAYGESGWEHFLDNHVKEGRFTIQLYNRGEPVSDPVVINTRADCRANLALVYFVQNWTDYTP